VLAREVLGRKRVEQAQRRALAEEGREFLRADFLIHGVLLRRALVFWRRHADECASQHQQANESI
jgi:hypothetical protein